MSVETYFTEEGRLAFRREWRITDVATGELLGAATRWGARGWWGVQVDSGAVNLSRVGGHRRVTVCRLWEGGGDGAARWRGGGRRGHGKRERLS